MPRHARLRLADVPFHVVQRGNNGCACFFADRDRDWYLAELWRQAVQNGVAVHAYVLMTNHVHLLMTAADADGIVRAMKGLGQCYAQYVNGTYDRTGTLWGSRYYSCLVDAENYLLVCHRYIESNPVRAGIVGHPGEYPWSSYRANATGQRTALLTPHPVIKALGTTPGERREAYRELFRQPVEPLTVEQIRVTTRGGFVLGGHPFQEMVARALNRRVAPVRRGRRSQKGTVPI